LNRQVPGFTHWYVTGPGETQHSWFALHILLPHGVPDDAAGSVALVAVLAKVPNTAPTMTASRTFFMTGPPSGPRGAV